MCSLLQTDPVPPTCLGSKFNLAARYEGLECEIEDDFQHCCDEECTIDLASQSPNYVVNCAIVSHLECVARKAENSQFHQQTQSEGHFRLLKVLSRLYGFHLGRKIDPLTEVLITSEAQGALFLAVMALINPGDEVIVIEPYNDLYIRILQTAGAIPVSVSLSPSETFDCNSACISSKSFTLDIHDLRTVFSHRTKALILSNPNNPLGKVYTKEELNVLANFCKTYNVVVIADETNEHIVFDEERHIRMCNLPGMWERTVTIGSVGGSFGLTGWRIGWLYGPCPLINNARIANMHSVGAVQTPGQEAVAVELEYQYKLLRCQRENETFFACLRKILQRKRDLLVCAAEKAGLKAIVPQGGTSLLLNWGPMCSIAEQDIMTDTFETCCRPLDPVSLKIVRWLAKKYRFFMAPPALFCNANQPCWQPYLRCSFFKTDALLEAAGQTFMNIVHGDKCLDNNNTRDINGE